MNGTWKKTGKNIAGITLAGKKYDGVFIRQRYSVREKNVMTFSMLNGSGEAVWGSK
ncbi:lipocalin-like domain-containing protein [Bacillus tequilensis]|uniref:lipocalin-like domain-containing protein n=1 Tax=Bacillus tequilensis TaxID=227866 RepID=UPI003B833972